jgi:hypothetical protein
LVASAFQHIGFMVKWGYEEMAIRLDTIVGSTATALKAVAAVNGEIYDVRGYLALGDGGGGDSFSTSLRTQ